MKGKIDAYVLWPLAQRFQNLIVDRTTARDFTVYACYIFVSRAKNSTTDPFKYAIYRILHRVI